MFRIEKIRDFKLIQKKLGALKGKYFLNISNKFHKIFKIMKKTRLHFFFQTIQKVQKMYGILEKTTVKFSPKSEQKKYSLQFFQLKGGSPPHL